MAVAKKKKPTAWQKSFSSGFKGTKPDKSTGISKNVNTQDQSPAAKERRRKARAKARSKA